jgi:very-short-patch-repair endonuclease
VHHSQLISAGLTPGVIRGWGLIPTAPDVIDVTVGSYVRAKTGICLHRTALDPRDIRDRHGLPTTSPATSLIAFAVKASFDEIGDVVAEARVKRLIRDGELEAVAKRLGRRAARMRAFLIDEQGPAITRSRAERLFRAALSKAGLPQPEANARIGRYTADFLWEAEKVVLEVDGWPFHSHRRAFERDRMKGMVLSDAGYHVSRVTFRQFTNELQYVIAHVARMLERADRRARAADAV